MSVPTGSKVRFTKPPFRGQKGLCSWCGTDKLPSERRTWCSRACVNQYRMRSDPSYIRKQVYRRDRGICAACGCDADAEYQRWQRAHKEVKRLARWLIEQSRWNIDWKNGQKVFRDLNYPAPTETRKFMADLLVRYAPGRWTLGRRSGWDADHIIPVAEGGGECDLHNLRTLCHPCHKTATKELAGRLSAKRRTES